MTITRNLVPGDRVKDTYFNIIGTVIAHPSNDEKIILVFDKTAYVSDRDNNSDDFVDDYELVDDAREAWDALNSELRSHILWLAGPTDDNGYISTGAAQKIRAIKLLRAMTGLGLADAKRAVETFIE